jgi:hypothetical protein
VRIVKPPVYEVIVQERNGEARCLLRFDIIGRRDDGLVKLAPSTLSTVRLYRDPGDEDDGRDADGTI